jgi:murein DD-endopeptidase MepM/ murein hydrolase activator NlpD
MKPRILLWVIPVLLVIAHFGIRHAPKVPPAAQPSPTPDAQSSFKAIRSTIGRGETLFDVFKSNGLDISDLMAIKEAAASVHRLKEVQPGQPYAITVDLDNCVNSFVYWIDSDSILKVQRVESGFQAEKCKVPYEASILTLAGSIDDNLISSIGEDREHLLLALKISDIFAWDIDFTSDLRKDDAYVIVVEGLYLNGEFRKFGEVLSAEFVNSGKRHVAYRFECGGKVDYYDGGGKSLKKAFLKAPLSFRRISSYFSRKRFHPILRTYRPHRGVDYAAARGTPVSATCDGTVVLAGRKPQYGRLVVLKHRNGYRTYYGHLSRIKRRVKRVAKVEQGDVIGYVGATGLASGPHLHYEVRQRGRHVNPLTMESVGGDRIPVAFMTEFRRVTGTMDAMLAASAQYSVGLSQTDKASTIARQGG